VANAVPAWDLLAGNLCVSALLAAERHRLRKGRGQEVELSLKDVAAAAMGHLGLIGDAVVNGEARAKSGNALYGAYGQDFVCADGARVMVIGLTGRQWSGLVKATGTADALAALEVRTGLSLRDEGNRWTLRHQITAILEPWFAARGVSEIGPMFDQMKLTWSTFRTIKEAVALDPDLGPANPMFETLDQPGLGTFPVPGSPATFSSGPRKPPQAAPVLGQHTEEVLGDVVGMTDTEISQLFDKGIVQSPEFARSRTAA
jgi:2-methylfumaryl-CoA isomerase